MTKENLSFNFTWNYDKICKNADEVSLREEKLVQRYGTQDSIFQKADGGGQTWASEKWFVKSNRGNPKFSGMTGKEIKNCLKEDKAVLTWLQSFMGNAIKLEESWVKNFINNMKPMEETWMCNFINKMAPEEKVWLNNFTNNMVVEEKLWLKKLCKKYGA